MPQRVPGLLISSAASAPSPRPDPSDPAVAVWRDTNEAAVAYCYTLDGERWIWFPDAASFHLDPGGDVTAIPEPGANAGAVRDCFHRFVLPMSMQVQGHEVLHASAVRMPRGVVVLCGTSHMGKSTLAYGLSRRGHPQWADDLVVFEPAGDAATAIALPFRPSLRSASASYFCDQRQTNLQSHASRERSLEPQAPLTCVCLLGRIPAGPGSAPVEVNRLASSQAFLNLLPHALSFSANEIGPKRRLIEHYLSLVTSAAVFEVRFQAGLENVPSILDAIEQIGRLECADQARGVRR